MSDRYRPPTGPKGPRGGIPSGPKGNLNPNPKQQYYNGQPPKRYKERDNYRPNFGEHSHLGSYDATSTDRPSGPSGYRESPGQKRSYPEDSTYSDDTQLKRRDYRNDEREWDSRTSRDSRSSRDTREWDSRAPRDTRKWNSTDSRAPSGGWKKDPRTARDPRDREYPALRDVEYKKPFREFNSLRSNRDETRALPPQKEVAAEVVRKGPAPRPINPHDPRSRERRKPPPPPKVQPKLRPSQIYLVFSRRSSELYQRVQQVGEGTYGKVYKAKNTLTGEFVALKKLRLESEREGFPITAIREIKLLQSFDHPNIVGLLEMMVESNQIFMVFDYLDHDLTGLLTHPDLVLTEGHRKMIFKQLMEGLNYLHKRRVIHRDIKGSNILLDATGTLKIADFGLARTMKVLARGESPDYTNRVITIWYRPPELLLGSTDYGREVDIWGVGCLLMELYTRTATFQGTEEISQLSKIFDIMGTPTMESWPNIENLPWFEMLKPRVNKALSFEKEFKSVMTNDSFDLAQKLLELVPSRRLTAQEALDHPYFHNEPKPERLSFMESLEGEWHEFETKKRRREERKRLQLLKNAKGKEATVPPTQPRAPNPLDVPDTVNRSTGTTPFDGSKSIGDYPMTDPSAYDYESAGLKRTETQISENFTDSKESTGAESTVNDVKIDSGKELMEGGKSEPKVEEAKANKADNKIDDVKSQGFENKTEKELEKEDLNPEQEAFRAADENGSGDKNQAK